MRKTIARPAVIDDAREYNETYREKAVRERKRKLRQRKRLRMLAGIFACCVVMALAVSVVMLSMVKTELSDELSTKQQTVADLDSEYTSLKAEVSSTMTLSDIENYAENQLGLVRLDRSQEEYLSVEKPDQVEVNSGSSGMDKLVSGFVRSFNAILSFLR